LPTDPEDEDEDEDEDNDSSPLALVLPVRLALLTEIIVSTTARKEHSTGARIKAIYMLEEKKSPARIKKATGVPKPTLYRLYTIARERG
jgi:hypothetical protein